MAMVTKVRAFLVLPLLALACGALAAESGSCFGDGPSNYTLAWRAQGQSFLDGFDFLSEPWIPGLVGGAMTFVDQTTAIKEGMVEVADSHAILRMGQVTHILDPPKRQSLRLKTKKAWTYGVAAVKYTHLPRGIGVWPSVFTMQADGTWPTGGELDLIELMPNLWAPYAITSFHTSKTCQLDRRELERCRRFRTAARENCFTDYSHGSLGCSVNLKGNLANTIDRPGVLAHEWTKEWVKVFFFPEGEVPKDLESDSPQPNQWDDYVIAWYPFAASEKSTPGICPLPEAIMSPQNIVFVLQLCGNAGFSSFPLMQSLWKMARGKCRPSSQSTPHDCCTQYANDPEQDDYYKANAFFNISWVKYYQASGDPPAQEFCTPVHHEEPPATSGVPVPCCKGSVLGLNGTCLPEDWKPEHCTSQGLNPIWDQGWYNPCCEGLVPLVRDWDKTGNYYYKCEPAPADEVGVVALPSTDRQTVEINI